MTATIPFERPAFAAGELWRIIPATDNGEDVTVFRDGSFTRGWTPTGPRFVDETEIAELTS